MLTLSLPLIFFILCNAYITITTWASEDNPDVMATIRSFNSLGLSRDEIKVMFRMQDKLETQHPDCFLRVAGSVNIRCRQDLMTEDERIHAAISLTLCELATANYQSPPLECVPFSQEAQLTETFTRQHSQRGCVEALSRSAQFWSSYSGYLREIPQLCFAFGRWSDTDLARDTYKNATLEKIAFLQHLTQREKMLGAQLSMWDISLSDLQNVALNMSAVSHEISSLSSNIETRIQRSLDEIVPLYAKIINDYLLRRELDDMKHAYQMNSSLSRIRDFHAHELHMLVPNFRMALQEQLRPVFSGIRVAHDLLSTFQNGLQKERVYFVNHVNMVHESMSDILININASSAAIRSVGRDTIILRDTQQKALAAAQEFHDILLSLTAFTVNEMEKINVTARSVTSYLGFGDRNYRPMMERVVYRLFSYIGHVRLQDVDQAPYVHMFLDTLGMLCSVVRVLVSASASLLVLAYSFQKYLRRIFLRTQSEPMTGTTSTLDIPHVRGCEASNVHRRARTRTPRIPDRLYRSSRIA